MFVQCRPGGDRSGSPSGREGVPGVRPHAVDGPRGRRNVRSTSTKGFIVKRGIVLSMEETTPDDLNEEQLYALLTENPDQQSFTPEDLEEYL